MILEGYMWVFIHAYLALPLVAVAGHLCAAKLRPPIRTAAIALLASLPLLAIIAAGFEGGCLPVMPRGERCFWFSFGLVVTFVWPLPLWLLSIGAGLLARWYGVRRARV